MSRSFLDRGPKDGNGSGRDWVTDCVAQAAILTQTDGGVNILSP
ncbi:MAG TPA: hypothetical protein VJ781_01165 [Pyrinomonadaceae bacterium]|nr:hypothetical protein [Pyrinomonadaceae bacterium]